MGLSVIMSNIFALDELLIKSHKVVKITDSRDHGHGEEETLAETPV